MERLGLEYISVFGLPPPAFIRLAAELNCQSVSVGTKPNDYNPQGYPKYSIRNDRALRYEILAAMRDTGVSVSLGEGFVILPGGDVCEASKADLDAMAELGVKRINCAAFDPDLTRTFDQLGTLTDLAATLGIETLVEFAPVFSIADLPTALAAIRHVGRRECRLLVDTMHVARTGATAEDLAALDPKTIGYVQLCDAPLVAKIPDYMEEARYERMVPGTGELPLVDMLAALPADLIIGLEVPQRSLADAGIGPEVRMRRCVEGARNILKRLNRDQR
jgi:sugar phosphate isomerase/epimerase